MLLEDKINILFNELSYLYLSGKDEEIINEKINEIDILFNKLCEQNER